MNLISIHGLESCSNHDASIALFEDGICTVCLPVERVTRNKHALNEHVNSDIIRKVLVYRGLTVNDIDVWLVPATWNWKKHFIDESKVVITDEANHHLAHIAGSFYTSNFEHACCICSDGIGGRGESITLAYATRKNGIKTLKSFDFWHSQGIYYETAANRVTGRSSEGKFMGLASWSKNEGLRPIEIDGHNRVITSRILENLKYNKNIENPSIDDITQELYSYWNDEKKYLGNINYYSDSILKYAPFAAAVQDDLDKNILELAKMVKKYYPEEENLCLSGGTFLNCTSNGLLDRSGLFKNIHCTSQPNDEGQAIGKGLYYLEEVLHQKTNCNGLTCFLGLDYTLDNLYEYINEDAIIVEKYNEQKIIDTLKEDGVIAWYQGRSEVGPRALCHRSLLASPHHADMLNKLSENIKGREFYRPLAPVCNDNRYQDVFDDQNPENLSQYMLKTVEVKEEWRSKVPAITHVDNTARPQYLKKEVNPRLYRLMDNYYEETSIPCLINTSLNAKGDPIIETPKDLLDFLRKNPLVDYCVFNGQYIITIKDKECL